MSGQIVAEKSTRETRQGTSRKRDQAAKVESLRLEDFWSLKAVSDPRVSSDGRYVAYVVGTLDEGANTARSAIWLLDLKDGTSRQITAGTKSDSTPRWAPDSRRLAFVSNREEDKPQIFILDLGGGEPRRLTKQKEGASNPLWSPDGGRICFTANLETENQTVVAEREWFEAHPEAKQDVPRMHRMAGLLYRLDGRGYLDKALTLFAVSVDEGGAEPELLTEGGFDNTEPAWSPDGKSIAFISNRTPEPDKNLVSDVWTLDLDTRELKRLTDATLTALSPAWSPDGSTIAFIAQIGSIADGYHLTQVWKVSRAGGDQQVISAGLDREVAPAGTDYTTTALQPPMWSPDGKTLYFVAGDGRHHRMFSVRPGRKHVTTVSGEGLQLASAAITPDGKAAICVGLTSVSPTEIYRIPLIADREAEKLTGANDTLMASRRLSSPEHLVFSRPDGLQVDGFLVLPPDRAGPHPLVLSVHGGPQGRYADTFYFLFHLLAACGYAVLYINPRGSTGYGLDFARAADWGLKDYEDLLAGVKEVSERDEIDAGRMAVTGVSYGGFMTNWMLGHCSVFKTGIAMNGVASMFSMYGSSDITALWFATEFGGGFWTDEKQWRKYRDHSPITYVQNITAPLLLLQSENDYRCPIGEGELMLTALRVLGRTVEMVRIPGASHVLTNSGTPHQRHLRWKLTLDWFERYLRGDSGEQVPE